MNLLIVERHELAADGRVTLAGARARHLARVLRVTPGQTVRVGLLDGPFGSATVIDAADGAVRLHCTFDRELPERPRVDVLLALPRPKVMRRLWAQLAAIGVGQIVLTNASKVERDYFDTHILHEETYRPLLIEGLQQARDTRLPRVSVHRQFRVLVEDHLDGLFRGRRLLADPSATEWPRARITAQDERVLLAIGPEGGWNDFERALLAAHGFEAIGVGPRTLRVDTACIALLAVVHEALEGRRTCPPSRDASAGPP